MSDDQDGCEWVFLLVLAYPGSPGPTAVKRLCVSEDLIHGLMSQYEICSLGFSVCLESNVLVTYHSHMISEIYS